MSNTQEQLRQAEQDIERLRRELEFARNESNRTIKEALEVDQSQHRIEVESLRKKSDLNQLRAQAEEVAKRRKLEKENAHIKGELQAAKQELSRFQIEAEELKQQIIEQKDKTRLEAQEEIASIRMQAKEAWRHAEEETSRLDSELAGLKQLLDNEKQQKLHAERTISKLENAIHQSRVANNTVSENFDKKHFDKLLKKAHLAIRNLQEKLKNTVEERDEYYKELIELREHIFEQNSQNQDTDRMSPFGFQSRRSKDDNVVPLKPTPFNRKIAMPNKPHKPAIVDLNSPLFHDELSDELMMIDGDNSFETNEDRNSRNDITKEQGFEELAPVENLDRSRGPTKAHSGLHGSTEGLDHEDQVGSGVAQIAKELLQEKEGSFEVNRSKFAAVQDDRYQFSNPSKKSHKWITVICIITILAVALAGGYYWILQNPSNHISNFINNLTSPIKPLTTQSLEQKTSDTSTTKPQKSKQKAITKQAAKTTSTKTNVKPVQQKKTTKTKVAAPSKAKSSTKLITTPASSPSQTFEKPEVKAIQQNNSEAYLKERLNAERKVRAQAEAEFNNRLEKTYGSNDFLR